MIDNHHQRNYVMFYIIYSKATKFKYICMNVLSAKTNLQFINGQSLLLFGRCYITFMEFYIRVEWLLFKNVFYNFGQCFTIICLISYRFVKADHSELNLSLDDCNIAGLRFRPSFVCPSFVLIKAVNLSL
jgi:hypothetical protein